MNIRQSIRAGSFYPSDSTACRTEAEEIINESAGTASLPERIFGGIVPHAGWVFSGKLAALTIRAVLNCPGCETLVIFGADHTGSVLRGEVYDTGAWRTPIGDTKIDAELAREILSAGKNVLRANQAAHAMEHSIEVQIPLLQVIAPELKIVPIAVPPTAEAIEVGRVVGEILAERFPSVRIIASSDLTHIGGHFGPAPGGMASEIYATENDRRMLDAVESMDCEGVIREAKINRNACGAGAIAASISACGEMGAKNAQTLEKTNSAAILKKMYLGMQQDDSVVGYASIIFA